VGELAPLLRHSRSATVQALEPTAVIEVPADQLGALVRRHEPLLRVIALALRDRAGLTETEIESAVTRVGGTLPREVFMVESPDAAGVSLPVPPHDSNSGLPQSVDLSSMRSSFLHGRDSCAQRPAGRADIGLPPALRHAVQPVRLRALGLPKRSLRGLTGRFWRALGYPADEGRRSRGWRNRRVGW